MIYIGSEEQVKQYREADALNQSTLKELDAGLEGFLAYLEKKKKEALEPEKEHFLIGGAVDTILTGEDGEFERIYHVSNAAKPTESILNVVNRLFERHGGERPLSEMTEEILTVCDEESYQTKWKPDTRVNKIILLGEMYYVDLAASNGKKVLSKEQGELVKTIVDNLRHNPRTADYFNREFFASQSTVDIYYQLPLYFTFNGMKCKALMDILIIENLPDGTKKVLPIDLKTRFGYTINFPTSIRQRRYDLQAAWYHQALLDPDVKSPLPLPKISPEEIAPFEFVVESTTSPGRPLVFTLTADYLNIGRFGVLDTYTQKFKVKGFQHYVEDYIYHSETGWVEDAVVAKNNGRLTVGFEGIER